MINIEHLDKTYHLKNVDVHAVDDVSLHIESGQIYGVIVFFFFQKYMIKGLVAGAVKG